MQLLILFLVLFGVGLDAHAGTINRPAKSFGGTSFINNVVPQASDFNGDADTIYAEFNGNIDDSNIDASANISPSKINPDGFTVNVRTTNAAPCKILDETDQSADLRRWAMCVVGGEFRISTYSDAGTLQNNWLTINRANGGFAIGGTSGSNVINGATTFNQAVTFTGGTSLNPTGMVSMYMGTVAPTGWLMLDGGSSSCTGASSANANLCAQLVGLYGTANYKGAAGTTVTFDSSSDEVLHTAHGKSVNDRVHFSTTGSLPTLASGTFQQTSVYCIISTTTDRFKISTACGGGSLDFTSTGSGTHSDYFNFTVPDARGRTTIGAGNEQFTEDFAPAAVNTGTSQITLATNNVKYVTGQAVTFTSTGGLPSPLVGSTTYYVIRVSSTLIYVASSLANAQNGTAIALTTQGTGTHTINRSGTTRTIGEFGGEETHAMSITELLSHTHVFDRSGAAGSGGSLDSTAAGTKQTDARGGNAAMNIMNPFIVMNYIIKL
jgi:microcystin-dependent protein